MADADIRIKVATEPGKPFEKLNKELDETDSKIAGLSGGFGKLAGAIGGIAAVGTAFNFVLTATREMEDLQTQFIAFTGSAKGASDQMERLTQFAAKSPFALADVAEANKTLLAFGSSTKQSVEQLKQLAEVSAATGKDLKEIATIFGQIQAEGKLTGERFGQLIERGINLGPEIAKSLGVAESSIKKLASEGKITGDVVAEAFRTMTSEGGKFYGSTERQSQTLSGSISSLNDNFSILASTLGSSAIPGFTSLVNIVSKAIEGNIAYYKEQQKIANETGTQKKIRELTGDITELGEELESLESKAKRASFLSSKDYQISIAENIREVTQSIRELSLERLKLLKQEGIADSLQRDTEAEKNEEKKRDKIRDEKKAKEQQAAKDISDAKDKAAEEQKNKYLAVEKQLTELTLQEQAVRQTRAAVLDEQGYAAKKAAQEKALADALLRGDAAAVAEETRRLEFEEKQRTVQLESLTAREAEITTAKVNAEAARQELLSNYAAAETLREDDKQKKLTESARKAEAERMKTIRTAQKEQFDIGKMTSDAQRQFDEQTYAQRVATAQTGLNALSNLMKSKNKEAFEIGKAAATAQALVSIPATAIDAYKSLAGIPIVGPALGAAAAAAAVYSGMEQVRNIQSQRLALAEGGMVPGIGNKDTVPALLTPGEVVVPKKNFDDLSSSWMQNASSADQIMLLQASNSIQSKILDTLTYGTINEKLTTMISFLDRINLGISNINIGSTLGDMTTKVDEAAEEIDRNKPIPERATGGTKVGTRTKQQ